MKDEKGKNIIIIALLVIILVLFIFIGFILLGKIQFGSDNCVENIQENENTDNNSEENSQDNQDINTDINNKSEENSSLYQQKKTITNGELMNLYKNKLDDLKEIEAKDKSLVYTLMDINLDDIPELIVKIGDYEAEYYYKFFTYDENYSSYSYDDYVVYAGYLSGGHTSLYKMNDKDYIMLMYAHMGSESISNLYLENAWIVDKRVSMRDNVSEYQSGDEFITLIDYSDTSLLDSYN